MNDMNQFQYINQDCCCFNLRKVTRAITQFYDRHLEPADIRATQFTLLVELSNAAGKTLTDMAEGLVMDRTTLTRNLKPLDKAGLIESVPLTDKRSKGYALTEKGRMVLSKGYPLWKNAQNQIVGQLGQERYQRLVNELNVLKGFTNTSG